MDSWHTPNNSDLSVIQVYLHILFRIMWASWIIADKVKCFCQPPELLLLCFLQICSPHTCFELCGASGIIADKVKRFCQPPELLLLCFLQICSPPHLFPYALVRVSQILVVSFRFLTFPDFRQFSPDSQCQAQDNPGPGCGQEVQATPRS